MLLDKEEKLLNSLYNQSKLGFSKQMLTQAIQNVVLDEKVRGEALSLEQFGRLTNEIEKMQK